MTNHEMAQMDLERAEAIAEEAENWIHRQRWNLVVRRSQAAVELALKAALRWAGLEVPRLHDVGELLRRHRERFPAWFGEELTELASISRRLRGERELSFYGDEAAGIPPEALYSREDAERAWADAGLVLKVCRQLMGRSDLQAGSGGK